MLMDLLACSLMQQVLKVDGCSGDTSKQQVMVPEQSWGSLLLDQCTD